MMAHVPSRGLDDLKEREKDVATLAAVVAVIIALYAVMFVALYRWSRYAPLFPQDGAAGPTITEQMPYGSE
jgi:hypothetical protein